MNDKLSVNESGEKKPSDIRIEYERIRFDRQFQHIVAIADRVNILSAASSILIVAYITLCFQTDCKNEIINNILLTILFTIGCLASIVAVIICILFLFRRFTPQNVNQKDDFFPSAENDEKRFQYIEEYIMASRSFIINEHNWLKVTAMSFILSIVALAAIIGIIILKQTLPLVNKWLFF